MITKKPTWSKPSPFDQQGYILYKRCPGTWAFVIKLFNTLITESLRGIKPNVTSWKTHFFSLLYKGKDREAEEVSSFRFLLLGKVLRKMWTGIMAKRSTKFMSKNELLDPGQKAGLPGVAGCLEHHALVDVLMGDSWRGVRDILLAPGDVADAYGTTAHSLITFAARWHGFPEWVILLMEEALERIKVQGKLGDEVIVQDLEIGGITGDPWTVVMFLLVMNMGLLYLSSRKLKKHGCGIHGTKRSSIAFMDDVVPLAPGRNTTHAQSLVNGFKVFIDWTKNFKMAQKKCEVFGIKDGKEYTPEITWGPEGFSFLPCSTKVRVLGKFYGYSPGVRMTQDELLIK
eukprot:Lithocolla_globosa_v1_NODE_4974_length_1326_cov_2.376082.p1 type:complete len:343 gc:universal NODE_4974_length_1326_cov_2.376082:1174-146(-)